MTLTRLSCLHIRLICILAPLPGIVKLDPELPDDKPLPPPPPRAKDVLFEDEEKSKVSVATTHQSLEVAQLFIKFSSSSPLFFPLPPLSYPVC